MAELKKIAFIIPSLGTGGAERVVVTLANNLCNKYEVYIITLFYIPTVFNIDKRITVLHCRKDRFRSGNFFKAILNNLILLRRLNSITRKKKFSTLVSFTTNANVLSLVIAKLNNIPCVVSERANPTIFNPGKFWSLVRKKIYGWSNYLIVQSLHSKNFFSSYMDPSKIEILPNPLSEQLERGKINGSLKKNVILNVGRMDTNKNQQMLINAFYKIKPEGWKLVLVGDGEKRKSLEELSKKLNISQDVIFTGNVSNTAEYYGTSKIFAFTSRSEGFPNVLIESMYYGLATISTDCESGPSDLIENGINGLLIPVDSELHLCQALFGLISDNNLIKQYGNNAEKLANNYKTSTIAKKWENILIKAYNE